MESVSPLVVGCLALPLLVFLAPLKRARAAADVFRFLRNDTAVSSPGNDRDTEGYSPSTGDTVTADTSLADTGSKPRIRTDTSPGQPTTFRDTGPSVRLILPPTPKDREVKVAIPSPSETTAISRNDTPGRNDSGTSVPSWYRVGFENKLYFGLRWPGMSIGVRDAPYSVEIKHLEESSEISITGIRLYHHLARLNRSNLYWGIDVSRISFKGDVSDGTGHSTGFFLGIEKRLSGRLSWSLDVGPYYLSLRDESTSLTVNGFEYTMTTGLNVSLW